MKKQLNVNAITNELRGNSAFFPSYKEETETEARKPALDGDVGPHLRTRYNRYHL